MRTWICVLGALCLWALATTPLRGAERVALVIGNDQYQSFSALKQAVGDAERVGQALSGLPQPFAVQQHTDLGRKALRRAVEAFGERLARGGGEVALVYFAGHAVMHDGEVWLLPVDAAVEQPGDVKSEGLPLAEVLGNVRRPGWKAVAVVLDACRNELFAGRQAPPGIRGDALPRGLQMPSSVGEGVIVAFATAAGAVAKEDGDGGYYTAELLRHLRTPGLRLQDVFNDTALRVEEKTGQQPELRLLKAVPPIYLAGLGTRPVAPVPAPVPSPSSAVVSPVPLPRGIEPELVSIPGGSYRMGSPASESGREDDEGPQTEITVRPFRLGKYEVTVGEFRRFVEATGYRTDAEKNTAINGGSVQGCFTWKGGEEFGWVSGRSWRDPGFPQDDRHPVVCVSWNDAMAYVQWLSGETGKGYRLPSEAEQEWALRDGSKVYQAYPWGGSADGACVYANVGDAAVKRRFPTIYADAIYSVSCDDGYVFTAPVGSFRANAYGLQDMSGNVWEWSSDCYRSYPGGRRGSEAVGGLDAGCEARVVRGASWHALPAWLRSADRDRGAPAFRFSGAGFRLALDR